MATFSFWRRTYLFTFRMDYFLFCLSFFALFCFLGTWQVHRYHYKQAMLMAYQSRLTAAPKPFIALVESGQDMQFQPIRVTGIYQNELTVYVQNIFKYRQVGFEVLTPLQVQGTQKLLLVDRGWFAQPQDQLLPIVTPIKGLQTIQGSIKLMNERPFILGKNSQDANAKPLIVQRVDIDELSRITHQAYYPFILQLTAHPLTIVPERHLGYAVQWFGLAVVMWIVVSLP